MPTDRRSSGPLVVAGGASVVSALLSSWLLPSESVAAGLRLLVALLPVPFFLWFILAEVRWVRALDEFHRRVILDSLAMAFPAAIALGVLLESVQRAGYLSGWTIGDAWPAMALLWVPSLWIAYRRYAPDDVDE